MSEASPRASRLATPRWLDARLVIGVFLVLFAVVAGARVFASADHYSEVYVARTSLVPGQHVGAADLSVGEVRFNGQGGAYVAADHEPIGYVVTHYVGAGEILPASSVSAAASEVQANRLVTVPVEPGHLPDGLGRGDLVDLYLTPKATSNLPSPAPSLVLASVPVDTFDGTGSLSGSSAESVVLVVPVDRVAKLIEAVESGSLDVVRVPDPAVTP